VRTQDYGFARTAVLLFFFLASILGLGIPAAPPTWLARNGTVSGTASVKPVKTPVHGSYAMAVLYAATYQDAGQAAPPAATAPPATTHAQPKIVELPSGDGKPLATEYCQDCHLLTNLTRAHKSSDDWLETVQTMMDRGARLPPEDVDTLVKYLARNFPPKTDVSAPDVRTAPAPAAVLAPAAAAAVATPNAPVQVKKVELPEGDGKAIAIQNCQDCHRLTNLQKARKSLDDWRDTVQLMIDRGANLPADQVETLVQYLAKNFGPAPASSGADAPSTGAAANGSSQSQEPSAAPAAH
jgi:mono/diheme cytochrome c family protein